jgi:hypothetical protein
MQTTLGELFPGFESDLVRAGAVPFRVGLDAICRFNPVHGQGMSVAAQEARALGRLLAARAHETDPLAGLAPAFFTEVSTLIDTPWAAAAISGFRFTRTLVASAPPTSSRH